MSKNHRKNSKKNVEYLLPGENQMVGVVTKGLGNCRYLVTTTEQADINCRIRGSLAKQRMAAGSAVIIESYLNVNSIIYIYPEQYVKLLREENLLPKLEQSLLKQEEQEEETFNFDNI
jgi:translation initiation factor IF-1